MLHPARPEDAPAVVDVSLAARDAAMPYLPQLRTDEETPPAWIEVAPGARGEGIGSALLARAKELRPAGFRLWVFQRNGAARGFYERRGLRLGELTDGAGNEEREPDALHERRP